MTRLEDPDLLEPLEAGIATLRLEAIRRSRPPPL
jgi:hypothetical protein